VDNIYRTVGTIVRTIGVAHIYTSLGWAGLESCKGDKIKPHSGTERPLSRMRCMWDCVTRPYVREFSEYELD
jgi:hypothetical protein